MKKKDLLLEIDALKSKIKLKETHDEELFQSDLQMVEKTLKKHGILKFEDYTTSGYSVKRTTYTFTLNRLTKIAKPVVNERPTFQEFISNLNENFNPKK